MRRFLPRSPRLITAKPEQNREQQNLQDLAGRKRADHGVGNDVQEEIDALLGLGLLGKAGHFGRVGHASAEARTRPHQISDQKPDDERECRDDLE